MSSIADRLAHYHEHGYVILDNALPPSEIDVLRTTLQPYLELGMRGRNDFEGERTQRVYSLVGRGAPFERTAEHPMVMALLNELLLPNYLLTASQAICIYPGETPQPVHCDDQFCWLARPRPPLSVSTIWALDDFDAENGGTLVIPGSHRWSDEEVSATIGSGDAFEEGSACAEMGVPVEMPAGSLIVFAGTLFHGGGQNRSSTPRRAFSHQYCEPWVRQQENFTLSIPRDRAKNMSPRLRQMLGYSIHPPFVGQIAGRHPEKALATDFQNSLIVDDAEINSHSE
jgi:ectoine hydroxylase-related dioxygenase (phytanoyl-CoA dioxygenase family)